MPAAQKNRNDQTANLARSIEGCRISVFIDAANLYHATNSAGIRVDFVQISAWFKEHSPNVDLRFYTAYDPDNNKQIQFLDELTKVGYVVIKKPIKDFGTFIKGNMDIELAVDAITNKESYDTLILISGDGDFTYLVNSLEKNYKKTIILSVGGYTSFELHLVADSYYFMNRISKVWMTPKDTNPKFIVSTDDFQNAYLANNGNNKINNTELPSKGERSHGVILKIDED